MAKRLELQSGADSDDTSIAGVVELVKTYARQETVEPIKSAGRFVGYGSAGALLIALGFGLILLGLLRVLEFEFDQRLATGALSWVSYTIVFLVAVAAIAIAISRIDKTGLGGEDGQ